MDNPERDFERLTEAGKQAVVEAGRQVSNHPNAYAFSSAQIAQAVGTARNAEIHRQIKLGHTI